MSVRKKSPKRFTPWLGGAYWTSDNTFDWHEIMDVLEAKKEFMTIPDNDRETIVVRRNCESKAFQMEPQDQ